MTKDIRCKYCDSLVVANTGSDEFRFSPIYFIR